VGRAIGLLRGLLSTSCGEDQALILMTNPVEIFVVALYQQRST
jgi:hypothetical protein